VKINEKGNLNPCINVGLKIVKSWWVTNTWDENEWINDDDNNNNKYDA